jgi:UDP-3-O-acyl-N-acetylglucosamine deacetylase
LIGFAICNWNPGLAVSTDRCNPLKSLHTSYNLLFFKVTVTVKDKNFYPEWKNIFYRASLLRATTFAFKTNLKSIIYVFYMIF